MYSLDLGISCKKFCLGFSVSIETIKSETLFHSSISPVFKKSGERGGAPSWLWAEQWPYWLYGYHLWAAQIRTSAVLTVITGMGKVLGGGECCCSPHAAPGWWDDVTDIRQRAAVPDHSNFLTLYIEERNTGDVQSFMRNYCCF